MTENENIVQIADESLNIKDVLNGITKLQCQMIGNEMDSLNKSVDAVICILQNENIEEKSMSQYIKEIKEMFALRESTLQKMLAMYEKMSDDLINAENRKVEVIKSAFSEQVEKINKCDLNKEDKFAAIGDVTYQIAELTDKLLFPGTTDKTKDAVVRKMACIIDSPDASESARTCAMNVLQSYMEWTDKK